MTLAEFFEAVRQEGICLDAFYLADFEPAGSLGVEHELLGGENEGRVIVIRAGSQWRVFRHERGRIRGEQKFPCPFDALDFAWRRLHSDVDNRAAVREVRRQIDEKRGAILRNWGRKEPTDELYAMIRVMELEMQPALDAARVLYSSALNADAS